MTTQDGKCDIHDEYIDDVGDCPVCEPKPEFHCRGFDDMPPDCQKAIVEMVRVVANAVENGTLKASVLSVAATTERGASINPNQSPSSS